MKKIFLSLSVVVLLLAACNNAETETTTSSDENTTVAAGQSAVQDDESAKDVVKVAAGSKDHSTLVAAVKQAELVDALSNAGPFTVFAPTNAAFEKVPKATLDNLMKDENKAQLQDILQYHVYVGNLGANLIQDGQTLNQVNGANITISKQGDQIKVNNTANVIASIPASNGVIHVIDAVLLPPAKQ